MFWAFLHCRFSLGALSWPGWERRPKTLMKTKILVDPDWSFQTNPKANALRVPLLICLKRCLFFWNTHNMRIKRHIGGVQPECEMCTCEALFLKANISLCLTKVTMKTKYLSNVSEYVWCQSWFFSCPQQLNRWPCPLVALLPLTIRVFTTLQSDPRDLWPLGHLIRGMRRHDLTKKRNPLFWNRFTNGKSNIGGMHLSCVALNASTLPFTTTGSSTVEVGGGFANVNWRISVTKLPCQYLDWMIFYAFHQW